MPLQKAITDFGADVSFAKAVKKLKEHYGIEVPLSTVRDITEKHGKKLAGHMESQQKQRLIPEKGVASVVGETDGSMVPVVKFKLPKGLEMEKIDLRKHRQVEYKEARLSLAHQKGSVTLKFAGTMGSVKQTGDQLLDCALQVGMGTDTQIHSVGDGATWIADQVDRVFGAQATFLVDFYHLCEYLGAASKVCASGDTHAWLTTQKQRLKKNKWKSTIADLRPFLESQSTPDPEAPVRRCLRYMENRTRQMDYKTAIAEGLPIGSGEIESAHGYIIQDRLKISGAWWREANAEKMIALRVARENGLWDEYWAYWAA